MTNQVVRFALLGVFGVCLAYGQSDVARIVGTVTDASGAVIPGATVTIKNERTGQSRKIAANGQGEYSATQLLPASYTLTAEATGMAPAEYTGVNVQVGQERRLNLTLQPATVNTEVNVSGGQVVVVDVSSARVGANVSEREVAELPLNGRQVSQLYLLAPGAVNNGSGTFDNIRFSGRSNQENIIRYDGVEGGNLVDASPGNLNGETT